MGLESLLAVLVAVLATVYLYGRKHQRWTSERSSHEVANGDEAGLDPAQLGVGERLS